MRAFVAVSPPPEVREAALRAARGLRYAGEVRWLPPENVHLTLKFLGEVVEESTTPISSALDGVCGRCEPFEVELSGFEAFPSLRRAKVLWAGVGTGREDLESLAGEVEEVLEPLGFAREERRFVPHATLGRARGRPASLPDAGSPPETSRFTVRSVELLRSRLSPSGAVYSVIGSFPFGGRG